MATLAIAAVLVTVILLSPGRAFALSSGWSTTASYPGAGGSLSDQSCVTSGGYVYCVGGINGNDLTVRSTYYAQLSPTGGIVGSWQQSTDYGPGYLSDGSCVAYDGYITCAGGWCTSVSASDACIQIEGPSALSASAPLSGSGIGSWTQSSATIPDTLYTGQAGGVEGVGYGDAYNSCVESGGYVYCIGGLAEVTVISGLSGSYTEPVPIPTSFNVGGLNLGSNVYYAQLSPTGGIQGSWNYAPAYGGGAGYDLACTSSGGYVYCVGGDLDSNPTTGLSGGISAGSTSSTNEVWSAQVQSNGDLGQWQQSTNYPRSLDGLSCAALSGYIYCVGGGGGDTYYAPLNSGSVGPWFTGSSYPTNVYNPNCTSGSGFVYCVGGTTTDDVAYNIGTNVVLSDSNSCLSIGGAWDAGTSTCSIATHLDLGVSLEVASGTTLDITSSGSVTSTAGLGVDSGGAITNSGTLTNDGFFNNFGAVTNSGTLANDPGVTIQTAGTITNTGTINNQGSFDVTNINGGSGLLVNSGTVSTTGAGSITGFEFSILNSCGGSVTGTQPPAGAIRNVPCAPSISTPSGQLSISGSVTVSGTENLASNSGFPVNIFVSYGCYLCNDYIATVQTDSTGSWSVAVPLSQGTYSLYAVAETCSGAGCFGSEYGSSASNSITATVDHNLDQATCQSVMGGTWSSSTCTFGGSFTFQPGDSLQVGSGTTLVNQAAGKLSNSGSLTILGTLNNEGAITNEAGGTVSDSGTITNVGAATISNSGAFTVNLNSATCQSYPLQGAWTPGAISTCTISPGTSVTIELGVVLQVPVGDALTNSGSISNQGTINLSNPSFFNNVCPGTITGNAVTGSGTVQFTPCAPVITTPSGGVYLTGTVSISGTEDLSSNGGAPMTITLYSGGNPIGSAATDAGGAWTVVGTPSPGILTLDATATSSQNIASPLSNQITATFQYLDQASCLSPINGSWSTTSSTCTLGGTYLLPTADGLEIPTGSTLAVTGSGTFTDNGTMTDLGTINNAGTFSEQIVLVSNEPAGGALTVAGTFANSGAFWNDGVLTIGSGGSFVNDGQMTDAKIPSTHVSGGGRLSISSGGSFTNSPGATMTDQQDSSVETYGTFDNNGAMTSGGFSNFENDGTLSNAGTMTFDSALLQTGGTFTNTGTITIAFTADELPELTVYSGTFYNYGALNLQGFGEADTQGAAFVNGIGGTIDNQFDFSVEGSTVNYGTMTNSQSQAAASSGGSAFSGILRVYNTLTNYGALTNDNVTTVEGGGAIRNYGSIANVDKLTNSGTLTEYCGSSITGNQVLGTPPVTDTQTACQPTISPTGPIGTSTGSSTIPLKGTAQPSVTVSVYLVAAGQLQPEGSVVADGSGAWSLVTSSMPLGSYVFVADAANSYGTSGLSNFATVEISAATPTTTTLVCTHSSLTAGSSTSCTATVSGSSPSGTVSFGQTGAGSLSFSSGASCQLAGGTCSVTATGLNPGPLTLTASYGGDSLNLGSSGTVQLVVQATPSISTSLSSGTIAAGQTAGDSATLAGGYNPTGTITFTVYADSGCAQAVTGFSSQVSVSGNGQYSSSAFTPTGPGTYYWEAAYSGDANNAPSASACGATGEVLTVVKASPTVSTSVSSASVVYGTSATDAATLAGGYGPTGTVTYSVYSDSSCQNPAGGYTPSTATVSGDGPAQASTPFTAPAVGTYYWQATYSGDANNNGFTTPCGASGETLTVNPRATSLTVICTVAAVNQPSSCAATATDTDTGTPITPTGTVDKFSDGGAGGSFGAGSCTLSAGSCSFTYTPLPGSVGTHITIGATYEGDAFHLKSTGSTTLTPTARTTSLSIACPITAAGQATTCTATVTDSNSGTAITPTGTVDAFSDGGAGGTFGSMGCTLSAGKCAFTYTSATSAAGTTVTVSAKYEGDTVHQGSSGSTSLSVMTPEEAIQSLINTVNGMNLPQGETQFIDSQLNGALRSLTHGDVRGAIQALDRIIDQLGGNAFQGASAIPAPSDQGNGQIPAADAQLIISQVQSIVDSLMSPTTTAVSCSPASPEAGSSVRCTATVAGDQPGGVVNFTSSSTTGSFGSSGFGRGGASCQLGGNFGQGGGQSQQAQSCTVQYTDSSAGTFKMTANYAGDFANYPSLGTTSVTFTQAKTAISVYCQPSSTWAGQNTTCMAFVGDGNGSPTGSIAWSSNSTAGSFIPSSATCTLAASDQHQDHGQDGQGVSCSVQFVSSAPGAVSIKAVYPGDSNNLPGSGSTTVSVRPPQRSTTTVECQRPRANQSGFSVACTVTVTGFDPAGQVTFATNSTTGSFSPPTCTLESGQGPQVAHCDVLYADSSRGAVTITASYSGDASNLSSSASTVVSFRH